MKFRFTIYDFRLTIYDSFGKLVFGIWFFEFGIYSFVTGTLPLRLTDSIDKKTQVLGI